jgi:hypothetical protein
MGFYLLRKDNKSQLSGIRNNLKGNNSYINGNIKC